MKKLPLLFLMLFISTGLTSLFVHAGEMPKFPNSQESDHFKFVFEEADQMPANQLLDYLEDQYFRLSNDFDHHLVKKIEVFVFSSVQSFHEALGILDGKPWMVACDKIDLPGFMIVSPANPGPSHTRETLLKVGVVNLAKLFIADKYKQQHIPYWLKIGVAYHEAGFSQEMMKKRIRQAFDQGEPIPRFSQLEVFNLIDFPKIGGFQYSYALVEFIYEKWGWDALPALMEDMNSFEKILGLSQKDFREEWIAYLTGLVNL